jgi:hypothetical protein
MRHIVFFLLIYFAFQTCLFGQRKSELDSIKKLVGDSLSRPNYQSLIEMFNENPATLDSTEGSIIYYGRIFNGYDPYRINFDEIDFEKLVGKQRKACQTAGTQTSAIVI